MNCIFMAVHVCGEYDLRFAEQLYLGVRFLAHNVIHFLL